MKVAMKKIVLESRTTARVLYLKEERDVTSFGPYL